MIVSPSFASISGPSMSFLHLRLQQAHLGTSHSPPACFFRTRRGLYVSPVSDIDVPPTTELQRQLLWVYVKLAAVARTLVQKYIPSQSLISFVNFEILTGTSVITKSGEHTKILGSMVYPVGEGDLFIGTSGASSCRGPLIISMIS
jgi:hypothetical protein